MPTHAVQVYRCLNLGDMIQTLALSRLLPPALGVFRHRLREHPPGCLVVLNGFLHRDRPPLRGDRFLFAGVSGPHWRHGEYLQWMRGSSFPIGARDPATRAGLEEAGLRSELVGCATLTFPRYSGPRHGVYSVDCEGPGTYLTHAITRRMEVSDQWQRASKLLETYRTAEEVYTSRLHVALPCLAFGTPVRLIVPPAVSASERFSILNELAVDGSGTLQGDVAPMANRYLEFLEACLKMRPRQGEPIEPMLPGGDFLGVRDRLRFLWSDLCIFVGHRFPSRR